MFWTVTSGITGKPPLRPVVMGCEKMTLLEPRLCACGCGTVFAVRRYARGHAPNLPSEEQFWACVDKPETGCWLWPAARGGHGVATPNRLTGYKLPYRVAWELTYGPIPEGMFICHKCDVARCVRPDHLFVGTAADNNADMMAKRRNGIARGKENGATTLIDEDIVEIRRLSECGAASYTQLSKQFGVHTNTIYRIVNKLTWSHL